MSSQAQFAHELIPRLFIAQDLRPDYLEDLDFGALPPFKRSLLVMVGLVTQFIEASRLEPVQVLMLSQVPDQLSTADPWLDAVPGTSIVHRQVLLRGENSGEVYVYGEAVLLPERLPEYVQRGLARRDEGLGRLLIQGKVECHGELLWCGIESLDAELPESLVQLRRRPLISRTYRFVSEGQPLMRITERFPLADDGGNGNPA